MKKPIKIEIKLTKGQIEKLKPVFKQAEKATKEGDRGVILIQPFQSAYEPGASLVAGFIPYDTAIKLRRIMNKYLKSLDQPKRGRK